MPDSVIAEEASISPVPSAEAETVVIEAQEEPAPGDWVRVLLVLALIGGALGRLASARHLSPHIDEPASVLAAQMVSERGLPIFPSGVPYFQGATLSYLLQPMIWLGQGDIGDLHAMRMVSVIAGILAIFVTYLLACKVSGKRWVGAIAALLMAIDPTSIKWSGLVRMYSLLELFSVTLVLLFTTAMMDGPARRRLVATTVVFWLAIFTHIAAVLFWPAMVLVAFAIYGRALWRDRRDVGIMLVASAGAPVALTALNEVLQTTGSRASAGGNIPGVSFVGDHLFQPDTFLNPTFGAWELLFARSTLSQVTPYIMLLISAALFAIYFLVNEGNRISRRDRIGIGALLGCYWVPIILVGIFTGEPQDRYLLHVMPIGLVIVAMAANVLIERAGQIARGLDISWQRKVYVGAAVGLVLILIIQQGSGILGVSRSPQLDPDYIAASKYVEARRQPGELVLSAMTPAPYLVFGENDDNLQFFSGNAYSTRTQRYTRVNDDGNIVDYWIGVSSVYEVNSLCQAIQQNPKAWIMIDRFRLYNGLAFGGYLAEIIDGMTYVAYIGPSDMLVLRPSPAPSHTGNADAICARAAELAAKGITETTWPMPPLQFN